MDIDNPNVSLYDTRFHPLRASTNHQCIPTPISQYLSPPVPSQRSHLPFLVFTFELWKVALFQSPHLPATRLHYRT
ncbi:hypothetical protein FRC03_005639 [Tulasnella sp. 419]|nr:hypothetical protein FRC03_005639 [Tulasnella sp. 419]